MTYGFNQTEINGGRVIPGISLELALVQAQSGYANSQIDDYGDFKRKHYRWHPGTYLRLSACFAPGSEILLGTAGFGFWNTPFGDPRVLLPTLPKAAWFFYASDPTDLPLALDEPGRGWFVSTIDATATRVKAMLPFFPAALLVNNIKFVEKRLWPAIRRQLKISFAKIESPMDEWHRYELIWSSTNCSFNIDGEPILKTPFSPAGPMAFVAWIDNQYLIATPRGRIKWGTHTISKGQSLFLRDIEVGSFDSQ